MTTGAIEEKRQAIQGLRRRDAGPGNAGVTSRAISGCLAMPLLVSN
jgi:hypothetical protein